MSVLAFNENNNSYSVEMKGIHFVCEKLKSGFEKKAVVLADIYLWKATTNSWVYVERYNWYVWKYFDGRMKRCFGYALDWLESGNNYLSRAYSWWLSYDGCGIWRTVRWMLYG